ncbi:unnamed protein product [Cylindrotheca closterium]|uniref:rhomboid protease n=1 Tax=Cylindrotheca closterium TaxID=2856 RepID=A0AAD2GBJ0_9STRA|nr:unnamed protein product [Cylindrotheca closterium]
MKAPEESSIDGNDENSSTGTVNVDVEHVQPEINHHEWTNNDDPLVDIKLDYAVDDLTENSTDLERGTEMSNDSNDADKAKESSDDKTEEDEKPRDQAKALLDALRANGESSLDLRLGRRARDFQFAQSERARKGKRPQLISSLEIFNHLADIRADIQWAEDAAWRRENGEPYVSWEDFEKKRKQKSWKHPYLTYLILISHCCMMVYQFYVSGWAFAPLKENPLFGPPAKSLFDAGGMRAKDMIESGSWWRLLSAAFLHSGIIHFLVNDLCIFFFGRMIEINHGTSVLFLVYFIPAVAGFVCSALFNPGVTSLGASGAVFGLIGASMADIIVNWNLMFLVFRDHPGVSRCCIKWKCFFWMLLEMVINWIIGLMPYIDNLVHMGGWIYGLLVGVVILERLPLHFFGKGKGLGTKCRGFTFRFLVATVIAGSLAYFGVQLSQSDGETIPYPAITPYFSCNEMPFWTEEKWWHCDDCSTMNLTADVSKTDSSTVFNRIEMNCPDGSMVVGDVAEFGYDLASQFSTPELQGICRKLC